ncbi:hypothetical protein B0A50_04072 [Salinomyces thailandicus]|uniref:VanZ-like domain-containing protein n=1 Tax=Salinomyces thailandicus TaxID=706561 RepID=A0A4U0U0X4_9PEZI|nr:hypothetical protein B0A50_04072 [Salinomyces thailandica]
MNIRKPFAASFAILLLASAYLGLSTQKIPQYGQSDKGLHFVTFLLLTLTFYWILETSRRRVIHLTLLVCTAGLCIGSEFVQAFLPNGRDFDPYDILANVTGSALALSLCSWYHKRMLERKRQNKHYDIVPGDEGGLEDDEGRERDVELGEGVGAGHSLREQETGTVSADAHNQAGAGAEQAVGTNITEELDNWDENAEDWDDEEVSGEGKKTPTSSNEDTPETKKRTD